MGEKAGKRFPPKFLCGLFGFFVPSGLHISNQQVDGMDLMAFLID